MKASFATGLRDDLFVRRYANELLGPCVEHEQYTRIVVLREQCISPVE